MWIVLLCLLTLPARAEMTIEPGDLRLWVEVEERGALPFTDEMVLVKIRGTYKVPITLENLKQPDLMGFGWMQLGPDEWFYTRERGQKVVNLERIMALFPEKAGTLTIAPFTHELTLSEPDGTRFTHRLRSEPIEIEVVEAPEPRTTWLPARDIKIEDRWSNAPEQLVEGASALRLVTVTIRGVQPETMPPMPELTGAGAMIFPHPPKQITSLRATGPMTRVFWRWTIRPERGLSGYVDPLEFKYYDAEAREARSITLSAQKVAYAGVEMPVGQREGAKIIKPKTDGVRVAAIAGAVTPFAPLLGLIGGLIVLLRHARFASWVEMRRRWWRIVGTPEERAFKRAARGGDAANVRNAARKLIAADITAGRYGDDAEFKTVFEGLDKALYGGNGTASVGAFAQAFNTARKSLI